MLSCSRGSPRGYVFNTVLESTDCLSLQYPIISTCSGCHRKSAEVAPGFARRAHQWTKLIENIFSSSQGKERVLSKKPLWNHMFDWKSQTNMKKNKVKQNLGKVIVTWLCGLFLYPTITETVQRASRTRLRVCFFPISQNPAVT